MAEQAQIQSQLEPADHPASSRWPASPMAEAYLDQTTVRAPSDGYITRSDPPMLPSLLRPVMVSPRAKRLIVAQFRQNSLLRLEKGDDAEAVFNALPGQVFHGKLVSILPVVPGGTYQAQGALQCDDAGQRWRAGDHRARPPMPKLMRCLSASTRRWRFTCHRPRLGDACRCG